MNDQHPPRDGGPAFPAPYSEAPHGMSLRDWFAGLVIQGMVSANSPLPMDVSCGVAYAMADAMLAARKATRP